MRYKSLADVPAKYRAQVEAHLRGTSQKSPRTRATSQATTDTGPAPIASQARGAASKHRNKPQVRDGIRFDSILEADYYDFLRVLRAAGEVLYFHRQVPIELPGSVKYRVDFLVFWADGAVTYDDPKGKITPMFRDKKKMVEALYPITIRVIKRGDFPILRPED